MKLAILLLSACVGLAITMTTTIGPTTTMEHGKAHGYRFKYDPKTHHLLTIMTKHHRHFCYIHRLSADERSAVHTDVGLRQLEIKVIGLLDTGIISPLARSVVDNHVVHLCGTNATHYYAVSAQPGENLLG